MKRLLARTLSDEELQPESKLAVKDGDGEDPNEQDAGSDKQSDRHTGSMHTENVHTSSDSVLAEVTVSSQYYRQS